jgi:hypothetical protein
MYQEGILPSGFPMRASVKGDVPAEGTMFSCVSCHLRSGMGSVEGTIVARPISGPKLYAPLLRRSKTPLHRKPKPPLDPPEPAILRPAYTDLTLARALREGIDPAGRTLDPAMPRYSLDDGDMRVLILYLKSLSAVKAPGTTESTIRLATVTTEGVEPTDRDAMLATLEAFVEEHNARPRRPKTSRQQDGSFLKPRRTDPPRLELARWELVGPPESWRGQLAAHQRAQPVFALLGGLAAGEWRPIHEFCEEEGLPSLFPLTVLPVVSRTNWHTLYFSKGLLQEGEAAARYLCSRPDLSADAPIVEILRDSPEGRALSAGFDEAWRSAGRPEAERKLLRSEEEPIAALEALAGARGDSVAVLWLGSADLPVLWKAIAASSRPPLVFVSSGLLAGALDSIPEQARALTYVTYPGSLPEQQNGRMAAIEQWVRDRGVAWTRPAIQSKAYVAGSMLEVALQRMRGDFYRDYLLDLMDTTGDQSYSVVPYERLTFGPGQRYASKGCYVVQLGPGPRPGLLKRSDWVVP